MGGGKKVRGEGERNEEGKGRELMEERGMEAIGKGRPVHVMEGRTGRKEEGEKREGMGNIAIINRTITAQEKLLLKSLAKITFEYVDLLFSAISNYMNHNTNASAMHIHT